MSDQAQDTLGAAMSDIHPSLTTPTPEATEPGFMSYLKDMDSTPAPETPSTPTDEAPDGGTNTDGIMRLDDPDKGTEKPKAKAKEYDDIKIDDIPDEAPANSTDKAKAHWGHLKQTAKKEAEARAALEQTLKQKETEWQEKLKEYETKQASLAELEEKARLFEEADKELSIHRIESSREFKSVIDEPLDVIGKEATRIAKKYEVDSDEILKALAEQDPEKRDEALELVMSGMSMKHQHEILDMASKTQEILAKADRMRAKASETASQLTKLQQQKEAQAKEEARQKYANSVGDVVKELAGRIPFEVLAEGETKEGFFNLISEKSKGTEFDASNPSSQAYAVVAAQLLPRLVKQHRSLQEKLTATEKRLAEIQNATPRLDGGGTSQRIDTNGALPDNWFPGKIG